VKAYDMAMVLIFINCGFMIIFTMGIVDIVPGSTSGYSQIAEWFATENFYIFGFGLSAMTVLAGLFAAATVVILNSNPVTDKGLSIVFFTGVFWGSWLMTTSIISSLLKGIGMGVFFTIFFVASTLIFINAIIQISSGGQQTHV